MVLISYFGIMLGIGVHFARKQKTIDEYLLASRSMSWFPIALSVMTAGQSAISYIGMPAWTYQHNLTMFIISVPILLTVPIVSYIFLPTYSKLRVFTAYQYLETRFNSNVRAVVSLLFLLSQGTYLGIVIYAASLVLALITGLSLPVSIFVMAGVTTFYTMMGGIKAVIWTDVIQFCVKVGGILITIVTLLQHINGGWQGFWHVAQANHKLEMFDFTLDIKAPFNFWGAIIGGFFIQMAMYGTDQTIVQRFMTAKSLRDEQRALLFQGVSFLPYLLLTYAIGPLLFVFYRQNSGLLNPHMKPDYIFPQFIAQELPVGISGLVIAAVFSAAMGTYSAAINSLSTVTVYDFYKKYWRPQSLPAHYVKVARIITVFWGIYTVSFALACQYLGPLVTIDLKVLGPIAGMILGVFLLGMLSKRATAIGVLVGVVPGAVAAYAIILFTSVSFVWYTAVSCMLTFGFGYISSFAFQNEDTNRNGKLRLG
jgi:SSS family solute:Na+ symporter